MRHRLQCLLALSVELQHLVVDASGGAAVDRELVRRHVNGELERAIVEPLVIVEEQIPDAVFPISQQCMQRLSPAGVKILGFIHDNGIVARLAPPSHLR